MLAVWGASAGKTWRFMHISVKHWPGLKRQWHSCPPHHPISPYKQGLTFIDFARAIGPGMSWMSLELVVSLHFPRLSIEIATMRQMPSSIVYALYSRTVWGIGGKGHKMSARLIQISLWSGNRSSGLYCILYTVLFPICILWARNYCD